MSDRGDSRTSPTLLGRLRQAPINPVAWREFVRRYAPHVYAWCRQWRLQDADAQDVTQDVLVTLAQSMQTFRYDPALSFRGYLRTIARRSWCDFLGSSQYRQRADGEVFRMLDQVPTDDLARGLESDFDLEVLEEACRRVRLRVAPQTWEVFHLRVFEQLSGAEVAGRLDMPVATVYAVQSRVQRMVRAQIRRLEKAEGDE